MLYYLDTVIVIYAVEGGCSQPAAGTESPDHARTNRPPLRDQRVDLARGVWSGFLGQAAASGFRSFFRFFHGPNLRTLGLTAAMHTRASTIRGGHRGSGTPTRSAAAVPGLPTPSISRLRFSLGCDVFLINDNRAGNFADITIEVLP